MRSTSVRAFLAVLVVGVYVSPCSAAHNRDENEKSLRAKYNNRIVFGGQYNALQLIPVAADAYFTGGEVTKDFALNEGRKVIQNIAQFLIDEKFNPPGDKLDAGIMTFRIWEFDKRFGYNVFVPYFAIRRDSGVADPSKLLKDIKFVTHAYLVRNGELICMAADGGKWGGWSIAGRDTGWGTARLVGAWGNRVYLVRGDELFCLAPNENKGSPAFKILARDTGWTEGRLMAVSEGGAVLVRRDNLIWMSGDGGKNGGFLKVADDTGWINAARMCASENHVFVIRGDELVSMAMDREKANSLSKVASDTGWKGARMVGAGGNLCFLIRGDSLICMEGKSGGFSKVAEDSGWSNARLTGASGKLAFLIRDDRLICMAADGKKVGAFSKIGDDTQWKNANHLATWDNGAVVVRDGRLLFMRADDGKWGGFTKVNDGDTGWDNATCVVYYGTSIPLSK